MSATEPSEPKRFRKLFYFGEDPAKPDAPAEPPLPPMMHRYLTGQDIDAELQAMTADERRAFQEAVCREFDSQERFRVKLYQAGVSIVQQLRATCATVIEGHEVPFCVHEEYARGYNTGNYDASCHAAELVAHALGEAMEEMEGPLG